MIFFSVALTLWLSSSILQTHDICRWIFSLLLLLPSCVSFVVDFPLHFHEMLFFLLNSIVNLESTVKPQLPGLHAFETILRWGLPSLLQA